MRNGRVFFGENVGQNACLKNGMTNSEFIAKVIKSRQPAPRPEQEFGLEGLRADSPLLPNPETIRELKRKAKSKVLQRPKAVVKGKKRIPTPPSRGSNNSGVNPAVVRGTGPQPVRPRLSGPGGVDNIRERGSTGPGRFDRL